MIILKKLFENLVLAFFRIFLYLIKLYKKKYFPIKLLETGFVANGKCLVLTVISHIVMQLHANQ